MTALWGIFIIVILHIREGYFRLGFILFYFCKLSLNRQNTNMDAEGIKNELV